jgi:hypothetical protein
MGMFLSLSGVIGRTQEQVSNSLANYAKSVNGGLLRAELTTSNKNCCVIKDSNNNTTIFYPYGYLEWDSSSEFISRELMAPVFSFHIHDGDLWMYILYVNGQIVDQFNPIPDYWDDNMTESEIENWKGNASVVAEHIGLDPNRISKYLSRWDLEAEENQKAYNEDEFVNEDWQLLDFLRKCGLAYPLDVDGNANGQVYKLWTKELSLSVPSNKNSEDMMNKSKPWWKFWE